MWFSCSSVGVIRTTPGLLPESLCASTQLKNATGRSKAMSRSLDTFKICESKSTESGDGRSQPRPGMVLSKFNRTRACARVDCDAPLPRRFRSTRFVGAAETQLEQQAWREVPNHWSSGNCNEIHLPASDGVQSTKKSRMSPFSTPGIAGVIL